SWPAHWVAGPGPSQVSSVATPQRAWSPPPSGLQAARCPCWIYRRCRPPRICRTGCTLSSRQDDWRAIMNRRCSLRMRKHHLLLFDEAAPSGESPLTIRFAPAAYSTVALTHAKPSPRIPPLTIKPVLIRICHYALVGVSAGGSFVSSHTARGG